jgi:multi-sensor hybrid histidine kinase
MFSFAFNLSCFIFLCLIGTFYFSRKKISNYENQIYKKILITSFFGMFIDLYGYIVLQISDNSTAEINIYIAKIYLFYFFLWITFFKDYMVIITTKDKQKLKKSRLLSLIIFFIFIILNISLPLTIVDNDGLIYSSGIIVIVLYIIVGIQIMYMIYLLIKYAKNTTFNQKIPLCVFFILGTIAMIIQFIFPEVLLITATECIITCLMYFTIENPDMKLLTEMHEAKEISDNANEEKTLFLYNMTQEIRATTKNIDAEADIIIDSNNIARDKESARNIKGETSKFRMMTNDILDVSAIDSSKIKIYNTSYSIKMLLRTIISSYNEICKNKNIEFRTNIDHNIPESLYGDNINLKKVLKELLDYSVKSTSKGYIELNINTIIKNDIARLIITIEDSSMGLKSSVLERITIDNKEFSLVYKLITLMNGTMVITSNYGTGNKIKIILDQKIEPSISIEEKKYQSILDNKKILIIDNTESTIKVIEKLLKESNIDIDYSLNGKDAYNKIKTRNRYDLILLDEELSMMTGVELLNYLKKIRNFNIPVILLSKDNKYEYNEEYLNMGFTDILIKPIKKTSLLECINKNIINREDVLTKNKETK